MIIEILHYNNSPNIRSRKAVVSSFALAASAANVRHNISLEILTFSILLQGCTPSRAKKATLSQRTNSVQLHKQLPDCWCSTTLMPTHVTAPPLSSLSLSLSLNLYIRGIATKRRRRAGDVARAARTRWIIIFVGSLRASSDSCGNCVRDPTPNEWRRRPAAGVVGGRRR